MPWIYRDRTVNFGVIIFQIQGLLMAKFGTPGKKRKKRRELILLCNLQFCHFYLLHFHLGEQKRTFLQLLYSKQFWFPYYQQCGGVGRIPEGAIIGNQH